MRSPEENFFNGYDDESSFIHDVAGYMSAMMWEAFEREYSDEYSEAESFEAAEKAVSFLNLGVETLETYHGGEMKDQEGIENIEEVAKFLNRKEVQEAQSHDTIATSPAYENFKEELGNLREYDAVITTHASGTPYAAMAVDDPEELIVVDYSTHERDTEEVRTIAPMEEREEKLEDANVLFIDDVIQSGNTAEKINEWCLEKGADNVDALAHRIRDEENGEHSRGAIYWEKSDEN